MAEMTIVPWICVLFCSLKMLGKKLLVQSVNTFTFTKFAAERLNQFALLQVSQGYQPFSSISFSERLACFLYNGTISHFILESQNRSLLSVLLQKPFGVFWEADCSHTCLQMSALNMFFPDVSTIPATLVLQKDHFVFYPFEWAVGMSHCPISNISDFWRLGIRWNSEWLKGVQIRNHVIDSCLPKW